MEDYWLLFPEVTKIVFRSQALYLRTAHIPDIYMIQAMLILSGPLLISGAVASEGATDINKIKVSIHCVTQKASHLHLDAVQG